MTDMTKTLRHNEYQVTLSVGANQSGVRLDRFLAQHYKNRSREQLKRAIENGAVTVDRPGAKHLLMGKLKASFSLQGGDIVKLLSKRQREPEVNFAYDTLYEDEAIFVLAKPPNLPVHPAGRFFFNTLLTHLKTGGFDASLTVEKDFFLVHRIDRETSGVLLLAKTKESCNLLTTQFRNRETSKYYLAIVHGRPAQAKFKIDTPIGKLPGSPVGLRMYAVPIEKGGLEASTEFEVIETRENKDGIFTLLACFPRTGRQHQIRVHAEIAGYPLVGDKIYGLTNEEVLTIMEGRSETLSDDDGTSDEAGVELEADLNPFDDEGAELKSTPTLESPEITKVLKKIILPRHALHAAGLRFTHPITGKDTIFEAPLPPDLRDFFVGITGKPIEAFKTKHW